MVAIIAPRMRPHCGRGGALRERRVTGGLACSDSLGPRRSRSATRRGLPAEDPAELATRAPLSPAAAVVPARRGEAAELGAMPAPGSPNDHCARELVSSQRGDGECSVSSNCDRVGGGCGGGDRGLVRESAGSRRFCGSRWHSRFRRGPEDCPSRRPPCPLRLTQPPRLPTSPHRPLTPPTRLPLDIPLGLAAAECLAFVPSSCCGPGPNRAWPRGP